MYFNILKCTCEVTREAWVSLKDQWGYLCGIFELRICGSETFCALQRQKMLASCGWIINSPASLKWSFLESIDSGSQHRSGRPGAASHAGSWTLQCVIISYMILVLKAWKGHEQELRLDTLRGQARPLVKVCPLWVWKPQDESMERS